MFKSQKTYFKKNEEPKKVVGIFNKVSRKKFAWGICLFYMAQSMLLILGEFGVGYPIFRFLFLGYGRFGDFIDGIVFTPVYFSEVLVKNINFSQPQGPPILVFYDFWRFIAPALTVTDTNLIHLHQVILILLLLTLVFALVLKAVSNSLIFSIVAISTYPFLFLFGRGNPDLVCVIIIGFVVLAIKKSQLRRAAILIGLIGAFKIPYLIFIGIFLPLRKLTLVFWSFASFTFFFFGSLATRPYGMTEQIRTFRIVTERYFRDYAVGDGGHLFNTSLYGLIKGVFYLFTNNTFKDFSQLREFNQELLFAYNFVVLFIVLLLLLLYSVRSGDISIPSQRFLPEIFFAITLLLIILPQISAEYRLALILPAVGWLLANSSRLLDTHFFVLLGILFLPKYAVAFEFGDQVRSQFAIGTLINPIIISILLVKAVNFIGKQNRITRKKP